MPTCIKPNVSRRLCRSAKLRIMNVKELKEKLNSYPDEMTVYMAERKTEYAFGLVNSVSEHIISILDEPYYDDEDAPKETVLVFDEE